MLLFIKIFYMQNAVLVAETLRSIVVYVFHYKYIIFGSIWQATAVVIIIIILDVFYLQVASSPKIWGSKPIYPDSNQKELQSKAR